MRRRRRKEKGGGGEGRPDEQNEGVANLS